MTAKAKKFRDAKGQPIPRKQLMRFRYEEQQGRCYYCKRLMVPLTNDRTAYNYLNPTLDHLIPICRGGDDGISNLVTACIKCNGAKGAMAADEFLAVLEKRASKVRMGDRMKYAKKVATTNVVPLHIMRSEAVAPKWCCRKCKRPIGYFGKLVDIIIGCAWRGCEADARL